MTAAIQTASYLLRLAADETEPVCLTHLHLQKLLYYSQGWSLALRDQELFADRVEAWRHGPVVSNLYGKFKSYGYRPIRVFDSSAADALKPNQKFLIASVWSHYRGYSAIALADKTHRETPWLAARVGIPPEQNKNVEITRESMKEFFQGRIQAGEKPPVTTKVDWDDIFAKADEADLEFLEAAQSVFVTDAELLEKLAR